MKYEEIYRSAAARLRAAGIADAGTDAWLLLEHVTGMSRARFYADGGQEMPEGQQERYEALVEERKRRIPVQHLTGVQEFMGLPFRVDGHVLIPRQDTEILVEEAERFLRARRKSGAAESSAARADAALRVLDLCTGSGCIAVSLKERNPWIRCEASDISRAALAVARENAERLGADVTFIESDLFARVEGRYDLIVSNPPYIPGAVIEDLEPEVREHDPRIALDGGADGLDFYRAIAGEAPSYLRPGSALLLEIGSEQADAVQSLLSGQGFARIRTHRDLAGLDRVVSAVHP